MPAHGPIRIPNWTSPLYGARSIEALTTLVQSGEWHLGGEAAPLEKPAGISINFDSGARDRMFLFGLGSGGLRQVKLHDLDDHAIVPAARACSLLCDDFTLRASLMAATSGRDAPKRGWRTYCTPAGIFVLAETDILPPDTTPCETLQRRLQGLIRVVLPKVHTHHQSLALTGSNTLMLERLLRLHDRMAPTSALPPLEIHPKWEDV